MTRVLVVEDYPPLATVVAIALRRSTGHEVVRVGSVQRAAAAVTEHPAFDVVVMDIDLPDGSGVELAVSSEQWEREDVRLLHCVA
ncbi:MAG: response regulator [Polyangiaceae bacterium]